ncbi:hypothetical protein NU219Hw_g8549t1 [Hortaea werneckii]
MSPSPLHVEVFTEYGISMCLLILRGYARWKTVGARNLDIGDVFSVFTVIFYTIETVGIYLLNSYGNNVGLNEKTAMQVPAEDVSRLTLGSKIAFMNWLWYISLLWSLKGVLLTLYTKIGTGIQQQERLIQGITYISIAAYIACILTHVCICLPPSRSWQIKPYPGDNCTVREPDYIVIAALNAITDIGIMLIPMPLLFKLQVPLIRKLALGGIFSLGIFVVVCTILRCYYSLSSLENLPLALGWASRETFVATFAVCAPGIKPIFSKARWFRSTTASSGRKTPSGAGKYMEFSSSGGVSKATASHAGGPAHEGGLGKKRGSVNAFEMPSWRARRTSSAENSDERMIMSGDDARGQQEEDKDILVTKYYSISREDNTKDPPHAL